ncbi:MAG: hypothetical protein H6Q90_5014, partial [Deltaproteobacteria bacterium]|nr:hypothetical protein [Deltaproteobacteria bacterium]
MQGKCGRRSNLGQIPETTRPCVDTFERVRDRLLELGSLPEDGPGANEGALETPAMTPEGRDGLASRIDAMMADDDGEAAGIDLDASAKPEPSLELDEDDVEVDV